MASEDDGGESSSWMGAVGASLLGGLLSSAGQKDTNETNITLGREQMQFQERMSNTAYQRAVADMGKAGINPMLATQVGGATTPSGAMPQVQNKVGAGVASASQAMQTMQAAQSINQSKAQEQELRASVEKIKSETMSKDLNTAIRYEELMKGKYGNKETEERIPGVSAESYKKWIESGYAGPKNADDPPIKGSKLDSEIRAKQAEATRSELGIARDKAESDFYKTDFGAESPMIRTILNIVRGASSALRSR